MTQALRLEARFRGAVIAYGIALFAFLLPGRSGVDTAQQAFNLVVAGLLIQAAALLLKYFVRRYERAHGIEGLLPTAQAVFDLIVDGISVLLFAVATFRGIAGFVGSDI